LKAAIIRTKSFYTPEPAAAEEQVQPNGKRDDSEKVRPMRMKKRRH
jgi:hypothetical protein